MKEQVTYVRGEDGKIYRIPELPLRKRRWEKIVIAVIVLAALAVAGILTVKILTRQQDFVESYYHVQSEKLTGDVRIVLLSDLHLREFGEGNKELTSRIDELKPDLIAITGDMNQKENSDYQVVTALCRDLVKIAPVYYAVGNHEWPLIVNEGSSIGKDIEATGVHLLTNKEEIIEIKGNTIKIGGLAEAPMHYEKYGKGFLENFVKGNEFKLLLVHYPEYFEELLVDAGIDVALCGHAHGGQIRIPRIGGLYTVDQGWFPKLTEGVHEINNTSVVISRGLGDSGKMPRVNNAPELVIVDLNWY